MKAGKRARFAAWLLTAAILGTEISGNNFSIYAMGPDSSSVQEAQVTEDEDLGDEEQKTGTEAQELEDTNLESESQKSETTNESPADQEPEQSDLGSAVQDAQNEKVKDQESQKDETLEGGQQRQEQNKETGQTQKKRTEKQFLSEDRALSEEQAGSIEQEAERAFAAILQEYDMYGVLANREKINILQEPVENASVVQSVPSGYQVKFLQAVLREGEVWFEVAFAVNDVEYAGYVESGLVVSEDVRLTEWKEQFFDGRVKAGTGSNSVNVLGNTDLNAFPATYRVYIQNLLNLHPNWTFVPMNTGLEWADVVANEMVDARNLVDINHPLTWKSTAPKDYNMATGEWVIKNGETWVQASESIVKFYLDPRNFINENSVFQFEQLTYNSACHNEAGVEKILNNTFMSHKVLEDGSGGGITYAQAFMQIGQQLKISPYFLASRIRQEQGVNGTSWLISGTYPGFEGYYNYFNISATGIGDQVIISGLTEAKNAGWTTRYAALYGGAQKTAENYILKGQDTFYLQKFDVDGSYNGLYWHQYMQNLLAADNESKNIRNSYTAMGALNNNFVFKVPVYNNMPTALSPLPGDSLSTPVLKASKNGYTSVKLSWNEVAGAQGYMIYRKEGANGAYKKIATREGLSNVSHEDKKIEPGKLYFYRVRAYLPLNTGNYYSNYSYEKSVDLVIPATSWNKLTVKNYTTVELSWNKVSVTGYQIYRKTDSGKYVSIKKLKGGSVLSYKDTEVEPGHTYSYKIRGYKTISGKNYYSSYTSVKTAKTQMATPKLNSVSVSGVTKAKLNWKRDSKADGYYVYRSTTEKAGYQKVKTISSNKTLTWSDSGIAPGTTYYYRIRSYVKTSNGTKSSANSKILMVKTKIDKPSVTSISASASGIKLKWKKSENAGGYQIYRCDSFGGKYASVKKVTNNATVTFTDKNVTLGKVYYYKVRAYRKVGNSTKYSGWSAVACAQPELEETRFIGMSGISANKATLKWQKVPETDGYKLYRKTGKTGKYQQIGSISDPNMVSCTDNGLKTNTTYYYKIRTWKKVNGKTFYSAYSDEWCVQTQ